MAVGPLVLSLASPAVPRAEVHLAPGDTGGSFRAHAGRRHECKGRALKLTNSSSLDHAMQLCLVTSGEGVARWIDVDGTVRKGTGVGCVQEEGVF